MRSIFNLCLALWLKSEQSSQSRPRGKRWQPLATLSRPLYAHKMSFCARRLTRHPNQSQALYGVSGKAQPLALLGSSLGSGNCDSGAGRAASLAARHHYLCAANITNNMKKTQQQFPRTDRRLKAGKVGKREGGVDSFTCRAWSSASKSKLQINYFNQFVSPAQGSLGAPLQSLASIDRSQAKGISNLWTLWTLLFGMNCGQQVSTPT